MESILASIRQAMSEHSSEDEPIRHQDTHQPPQTSENPPGVDPHDVLDLHTAAPIPEQGTAPEPAPSLLSEDAEQRTRSAIQSLDEQIQRKQHVEIEQAYIALERMLYPILKQWCDQHLPDIVTRSVQKEIKELVLNLSKK